MANETCKKYILKNLKQKPNKGYFRAIYKHYENKKVLTTLKIYFKAYVMDMVNYDSEDTNDQSESD